MRSCDSVRTAASISRDLLVFVATMLVAYHRAIMAAVSDQRCCSAAMMDAMLGRVLWMRSFNAACRGDKITIVPKLITKTTFSVLPLAHSLELYRFTALSDGFSHKNYLQLKKKYN